MFYHFMPNFFYIMIIDNGVYNTIMVSAIIAGLLPVFGIVLALFIARLWFERQKAALITTLKAYFETNDPDTPSQFGAFIDIVSSQFASKLVSSLRAQINQMASVGARQENQINAALTTDMISQMPLAGALLSAFPALGKMVKKNPAIAGLVQSKIEEMIAKKSMPQSSSAPTNGGIGLTL